MSTIGIVGGTGPQGSGLGFRFARAGHRVVLGSRSQQRAAAVAAELAGRVHAGSVEAAENAKAVEIADLVLLAVPYLGHDELVADLAPQLAGKVVVSCVNPLGFDKRGPYGVPVTMDPSAPLQRPVS